MKKSKNVIKPRLLPKSIKFDSECTGWKSASQHLRKTARMSYNRFWMLWLAEHAPKSTQYRLNKFGRLTPKIIRDAQKDYFEVTLSKSTASFNEKRKSTIQHRK